MKQLILILILSLIAGTQSFAAGGIIFFTTGGSSYVNVVQYETLSSPSAHLSYLSVKGGKRMQIPSAGIISAIPFPDASKSYEASEIEGYIVQCEMMGGQSPKYAETMQKVAALWQRQQQILKGSQKSTIPKVAASTATAPATGISTSVVQPLSQPTQTLRSIDLKSETPESAWGMLVKTLQGADFTDSLNLALACKSTHPQDQQMLDIADALVYISKAMVVMETASKMNSASQPEINRLLRNADVSDKPNPLNSSDVSGKQRAEFDRNKAKGIQENCDQAIKGARMELEAALLKAKELVVSFGKAGVLDGAVAVNSVMTPISAKYGLDNDNSNESGVFKTQIIDATGAFYRAKSAYANKEFSEANEDLKKCLSLFSAYRPGLALQQELQQAGKRCKALFSEAIKLKEEKQYEGSLKKLEDLTGIVVDFEEANTFKSEILSVIEKKDSSLSNARLKEQSLELDSALTVFEQYNCTADIQRVSAKLAEKSENDGNFIGAVAMFEKAGLPDRAATVRQKAQEQGNEYKRAEILLAEHKLDESLAIYEKYKDKTSSSNALRKIAMLAEGNSEFETALELYRRAGASEAVERTKDLLNRQKEVVSHAAKKEESGDYETAAELYEEAGATVEFKRACLLYAKALEAKGEYASAVGYFERGDLPKEAKRIREAYAAQIENASSKGGVYSAEEIYKKNIDAVVTVIVSGPGGKGHGSGFFVKKGGWIVTNNHVTDDAAIIKVRLNSGKEYPAKLVDSKEIPDFALLKIDMPLHKVVRLGDSAKLAQGEPVFAIGTPVDLDLAGTITGGMVSNKDIIYEKNPVIQISASINHGNSGGPLFSAAGLVIGVNTFGLGTAVIVKGVSVGSDVQNINFAIQINAIRPLIDKCSKAE